jgi:hypothetical protein
MLADPLMLPLDLLVVPVNELPKHIREKMALRCFAWVIAFWADRAGSAALRLLKVEAGINGLRSAYGRSPPFNPFLP